MGDSHQPGAERFRPAQGTELAIGSDKRLLGGVVGQVIVPHDIQGRGPNRSLIAPDEQLKRLLSTGHAGFHQF